MNTTKLVTAIILAVIYSLTFLFFLTVTVIVNKKTDKMDKSINLMLLCLMIASLCKFSFFYNFKFAKIFTFLFLVSVLDFVMSVVYY